MSKSELSMAETKPETGPATEMCAETSPRFFAYIIEKAAISHSIGQKTKLSYCATLFASPSAVKLAENESGRSACSTGLRKASALVGSVGSFSQ